MPKSGPAPVEPLLIYSGEHYEHCIFPGPPVPPFRGFRPLQRPVRVGPAQRRGSSYPPYNVEKHGDDQYRIVVAAAGFQEDDLELQVERGVLTVSGGKRDKGPESSVTYLHQGIAQRAFKLSFRLADHIEVKGASLQNGLLNIDLVRVVPEEAKPKRIPIGGNGGPAMLEH